MAALCPSHSIVYDFVILRVAVALLVSLRELFVVAKVAKPKVC